MWEVTERSERSLLVLINEGGKRFRVERSEGHHATRGVTAYDFDQDGDLDVYVSNYRLRLNLLWLNDGKAGFREVAGEYGVAHQKSGAATHNRTAISPVAYQAVKSL